MAANGISTLPTKIARIEAKIALAQAKRQAIGTNGYRVLNYYIGTVSPTPGRPWSETPPIASGTNITTEDGNIVITEDNFEIVTE